MEFADALTITVLGMTVVFSGLLLTAGLIFAFGRLQALVDRMPTEGDRHAVPSTRPAVSTVPSGPPLDSEILTVIVTVLEIEHRLRRIAR